MLTQDIVVCKSFAADITESEASNHPDVIKAVENAVAVLNESANPISQEMYMEALANGINMAEERRREKETSGMK